MLADVVEAAEHAVLAADDDDVLIGNAAGDVTAGLGQRAKMAGIAPGAGEDRRLLPGIDLWVDIMPRGQGIGPCGIGMEPRDPRWREAADGQIAKPSRASESVKLGGDDG
jgi:hypothetical protein